MRQESPKTFYHAISQKRIQDAISKDRLPGLSKSQFHPEVKRPGIWLSDQFALVFEKRYGEEYSSEVAENAELQQKGEKRTRSPIILELEGINERSLRSSIFWSVNIFFYVGDLEWEKVKRIYVSNEDKDAVETAREMVEKLKAKGIEVEITEFSESFLRESLRVKPQKDNRVETENLIIKLSLTNLQRVGKESINFKDGSFLHRLLRLITLVVT